MRSRDHLVVARTIRQLRVEAGLHQTELALRLGIAQSGVSKFEMGERRLDIIELREICTACGVPLATFVARLERALSASNRAR